MKPTLLFDLDGTLADPYEAFAGSLLYAMKKNGYPAPAESRIRTCIGPPLQESLVQILGVPSEKMQTVLADYRTHHEREGINHYRFFPEASPLLEKAQKKFNLFVATSKPHYLAVPIFLHHGMDKFFQKIYGAEKDGLRSNKGDLIAFILQQQKLDKNSTYMIGDRKHDILGARKNGIQSLGVEWGFAEPNELRDTQATHVFCDWNQLGDFLALT